MLDVLIANWILLTVSFMAGSAIGGCFHYKNLSEKDLFTGCFNKDWAIARKNSKLVRMMKHTNRKGVPFGLVFIDFDNFKEINDSEGHAHGDEVILNTVSVIKSRLGNNGITVRFGGDELMALVPNTYLEELRTFCEKLCIVVQQQAKHTISIGGVIFSKGNTINVKNLIEKADNNLYTAKENGKNCAVVA